jgi:aryl-phospho-beta-D-glucosidase BglC (GH1 family)
MKYNFTNFILNLFCILFTLQLPAMTTKGNQILNSEGKAVELKGVNWFGFNNQSTMVDGLWGGPDSLSYDFATVVYRLQLLGFNAVRLPFSFKDLHEVSPRNYLQHGQIASISHIQKSVTSPAYSASSKLKIPAMRAPPFRERGMINEYLPNDSTFHRFLWVVNFFAKNGFYVLIDNHLREDQTVLENPQKWVQHWVTLATAIAQDPIAKERVMIDLLNEPDNFGLRWEASNQKPGLKDIYLSAMDALYQVDPHFLFFIEGTGQGGINANWGDGFATDAELIKRCGLSDPNPFFKALLNKPYVDQVVISPHVYPPSVTNASQDYQGADLWKRLSASFGYLTQQGYKGKVFPVAIGEFGSRFTEEKDLQSMHDMAEYFQSNAPAADGKHKAIPHWFYWSWNANSGDTGGVVADNRLDIQWKKIDYLTQIGLKPWYLRKSNERP